MIADDVRETVSHYLVWTCCPASTVRTLSAISYEADTAASEAAVCDAAEILDVTVTPSSDGVNADTSKTADANAADGEPPAKISRQDHCSVVSNSAATSEAAVFDASERSLPDSSVSLVDDRSDDVKISCDISVSESADVNSASSGPPASMDRDDKCAVSPNTEVLWRCLGLAPVTSFSVEHKNLVDYRRNFRVQPILFSGAVLPHLSVVIN